MIEYVDIVNTNGSVIGKSTRKNAHAKGLLHPTVKVLLFNSSGRILIQLRSSKKIILPLCWDISVAEHLKTGETYKDAATRGLKEELSIKTRVRLLRGKHIQKSEHKMKKLLKEYELTILYGAVHNGKIISDPKEVKESLFVPLSKLAVLARSKPAQFTPWGLNEANYILTHTDVMEKLIQDLKYVNK